MPQVNRQYVTIVPVHRNSDGFTGYQAQLLEANSWNPAGRKSLPDGDIAYAWETGEECTDMDRFIRVGPESDAGLIARGRAIDWARKLGVPYLD